MSFVTFDYYFLKFVYIFFGFPDKVAVESQENMYVCISQSKIPVQLLLEIDAPWFWLGVCGPFAL